MILTVHPHACGADVSKPNAEELFDAVHPHACGADSTEDASKMFESRFIPTRVGQMQDAQGWTQVRLPVHPHACGADSSITQRRQKTESVHPHACGADPDSPMGIKARIPVHPHACGADFGAKGFQAKV